MPQSKRHSFSRPPGISGLDSQGHQTAGNSAGDAWIYPGREIVGDSFGKRSRMPVSDVTTAQRRD
jgi:hypothetical protein